MTSIVMLHGWGMTGGVFRELAQALAAEHDVSAPDLPGHGGSAECEGRSDQVVDLNRPSSDFGDIQGGSPPCSEFPEPYTLERLAAEVAERAPRRCLVVGWSLGAQVALRWARARPRQVEKLALIGATPCFVQRADWTCAMPQPTFDAFAVGLARDPAATLTRFVSLQARGDAAAKAVTQRLRASVGACPDLPALRAGLTLLRETDLRDSVRTIAQPALVIHGDRDELAPLAAAEALAGSLPGGSLAVVGGAAHAPFVSSPARVARLIGAFFA